MSNVAEQIFADIQQALSQPKGAVQVTTYTNATLYRAKHKAMFKLGKDGSLLVQSGKRWNCIATPSTALVSIQTGTL